MLRSLLQLSSSHFIGLLAGKLVSTIGFIVLARMISVDLFGEVLLFNTIVIISGILGSFGLNQSFQLLHNPQPKDFSVFVHTRIVLFLFTLPILFVLVLITPSYGPMISALLTLAVLSEAALSICQGLYLQRKNPLPLTFPGPLKLVGAVSAALISPELVSILIGYTIANIISTLFIFPWREYNFKHTFSMQACLSCIRQSARYGILTSTSLAYSQGDALIVRYSLGSTALGYYGAAYRFLESLSLFPSAITQNLFHLSAHRKLTNQRLFILVVVMTVMGVIAGGSLYLLAPQLVQWTVGEEYISIIPLLRVFSLVLVLFFINAPLSTVVQSTDEVRSFLPYGIANTVVNLLGNVVLVPMYGIMAAGWMMLATEISGLCLNLVFFIRHVQTHTSVSTTQ